MSFSDDTANVSIEALKGAKNPHNTLNIKPEMEDSQKMIIADKFEDWEEQFERGQNNDHGEIVVHQINYKYVNPPKKDEVKTVS